MSRFAGKGALVLGAAGRDNMGQTIARRLHDEGARVVVAGRNMEELQRFADEIGGFTVRCDITRRDDVVAMVAQAKEKLGRLDIAVNATGWGLLTGFLETTEDEFDQMSALSFKGPFMFMQALVPAMERGGSFIQISSATATIMLNDHAAYMGAKAGTNHLVRIAAHEFGHLGLRFNSVSPGLTETPMTASHMEVPGLTEAFLQGYPLGRIGTQGDIAAAVAFLASEECFMTGEDLQVNGGLTLRRNPTRDELQAAIARAATSAQ